MSTKNHIHFRYFFSGVVSISLGVFGVLGGVVGFEPVEEVVSFGFVGLPLIGEDAVLFELQELFFFRRRHI